MIKVIIAIIASGLIGYMGGIAQERHYGHQRYLEGLDEGYGNAKKIILAYKAGKDQCYRDELVRKIMNGEEIEFEDSE